LVVRAIVGHRVKRVGECGDPSGEGDGVGSQLGHVAGAVPPLDLRCASLMPGTPEGFCTAQAPGARPAVVHESCRSLCTEQYLRPDIDAPPVKLSTAE
jgi:hypothetical protein